MKATLFASIALAALFSAAPAMSAPEAFVAGQKIDSGLGDLPVYAKWSDRTGRSATRVAIAGESIDSGLGELPHYSKWKDVAGKNTAVAKR